MRLLVLAVAAFLSAVCFTQSFASAEGAGFTMRDGPFDVGIRVARLKDPARSVRSQASRAEGEVRALQALVWYPAKAATKGDRYRVGDYVSLPENANTGTSRGSARGREWRDALGPALDERLLAVGDATPAADRFPVIVYAPSFSAPAWENADLCEYLASHGYVVIASPSIGASGGGMTGDIAGVEAQVSDIRSLIDFAATLPNADVRQLAVVGFSWGGFSNVVAAARDERIHALISLDGSIRYWSGLLARFDGVDAAKMKIPLLYVAQSPWAMSMETQARYLKQNDGPSALNGWVHGDAVIAYSALPHAGFSSMFQRNRDVWNSDVAGIDEEELAKGSEAYGWMARYTLAFVDAYLKKDATAMAFLKRPASENKVPKGILQATFRSAVPMLATAAQLRATVERDGFASLRRNYARLRDGTGGFELTETDANSWAEDLLDGGRYAEAIALLGLSVEAHPQSASAHAQLARAYKLSGNSDRAREAYQKALNLNPDDGYIRHMLAKAQ